MNHKDERNRLLQVSRDFERAWRELRDEFQGKAEVLSRFDNGANMQLVCEAMEADLERTVANQINALSVIDALWPAVYDELTETTGDMDKRRRLRLVLREIKEDHIQTSLELGILQYWWYVYVDVCDRATEVGWDHTKATIIFQKAIRDNMRFWRSFVYIQALCAGQDDAALAALVGVLPHFR